MGIQAVFYVQSPYRPAQLDSFVFQACKRLAGPFTDQISFNLGR